MDLNQIPTFDDFVNDSNLVYNSLDSNLNNKSTKSVEDNIPTFDEFSKTTSKHLKKINKSTKVIIPTEKIPLASASQGGFVASGYGSRKPPKPGASSFHQGIDINAQEGMDVSPADQGEVIYVGKSDGKGLSVRIKHPDGRITEYNHLSKTQVEVGDRVKPEAVIGNVGHTGIATGPHLDFRVLDVKGNYVNPVNELELDPKVNGLKLKLKQIPTFDEELINSRKEDFGEIPTFDEFVDPANDTISGVQGEELTEPANVFANKTLEERASIGAAQKLGSKPIVTVKNPHQLISDQVSITINAPTANAINKNEATDKWLEAIDPNYGRFNKEYRSLSGRNLVDFEVPSDEPLYKSLGNNQYQLSSRLQAGAKEVINAYINGRNKGGPEAGWEAAYFKSQEIKREHKAVVDQVNNYYANEAENYAKQHPYLSAVVSGFNEASPVDAKAIDIGAGLTQTLQGNAQLLHNLRTLPTAIYLLEKYGGDSKEYQDALEKDLDIQRTLIKSQETNYQPKDFIGQVTKGAVEGIGFLPKAWAVAPLGPSALPLLVYTENIHRGNRAAVKAALPMALLVGSTHGLSDFLTSGTKVYSTILDEQGNAKNVYETVGRGLGNKAPFVKGLSEIDSKLATQFAKNGELGEIFLSGEPVSIGSLTALQRQLIMRGSNALFSAIPTALEGGGLTQTASSLVVGLTFPIGKYKAGEFSERKLHEAEVINSPAPDQIDTTRIDIPLDKWKLVGEQEGGTGFQAFKSPSSLRLDMDTAALSLLDMRKALKDKSIVNPGLGLKESMKRFADLQVAIKVLEEQIPKPVMEFFEKNEALVRSGLKTNWEAVKAKEEYLGKKQTEEIKTPDQIKENPNVDVKENPIERLQRGLNAVKGKENNKELVKSVAASTFGNIGNSNGWITPDRALFLYEGLLGNKGKDGIEFRRSGLTLDDMKASGKAIWNLTQIAAFHLEDFYHRGIKPSVDELANRFRLTLGDVTKNLRDKDFNELFIKGQEYLDSNIADPFFSKLKQDALEKLPSRITAQQALDVLQGNNKNEFEWTAGLNEFLEGNKDKKFTKQELIDVIQKGQVRVEASVANENENIAYKDRRKSLLEEQDDIINKMQDLARNSKTIMDWPDQYSALSKRAQEVRDELSSLEKPNEIKYSLKAYTHEKLELPGASNSKEVKLISSIADDKVAFNTEAAINALEEFNDPTYHGALRFDKYTNLYKSNHWDEPNIVAHYRSNDRTTTDNIPISFSEEFQSDWNHDIREKGVKLNLTKDNYEQRGYKIAKVYDEKSHGERWIFGRDSNLDSTNFEDMIPAEFYTQEKAIDKFIENYNYEKHRMIEPNPFMQHSWKELVFKRFLRDAIVAKDENGNNKYEGIGWTTTRQQKERYGKILEGKDFNWTKNENGTYTFGFINRTGNAPDFQGVQYPHELSNISLERFAELTTKEAAEEVRSQENKLNTNEDALPSTVKIEHNRFTDNFEVIDDGRIAAQGKTKEKAIESYWRDEHNTTPSGKFSLEEAVELRSGIGKYSDYDEAMVNYAKKIGKRFGAKYSQKEIITTFDPHVRENQTDSYISETEVRQALANKEEVFADTNSGTFKLLGENQLNRILISYPDTQFFKLEGKPNKNENIHFLEITPSMRESLSKEGLPLYGLGQSERLNNPEIGIRNKIISNDAFNQAREELVNTLSENNKSNQTTTFNSGLSPDAFIDQVKLLYQGYKDLASFTKDLVQRYGEPIRQFAEDFWFSIKDKAQEFNEKLDIKIDNWQNRLDKVADDPAWQIRQGEQGAFSLRKKKSPELDEYLSDQAKHQSMLDWRFVPRGIALSQLSTHFAKVYDSMRIAQRVVNNYQSNIISQLKLSKKLLKSGLDKDVAEAIYSGNESQKVFSDPELTAKGLNADQIAAYKNVRAAVDNVLNLRLETKLYGAKKKADQLNDKLSTLTTGTPEHDAVLEKLLDLGDSMKKMVDYYQQLKDEGYISLQRRGKIAAFIEDTTQPATITKTLKNGKAITQPNPDRKIYNHFDSKEEADKWLQQQKTNLGIASTTLAGSIYDLRKDISALQGVAIREKLTPSQFEDLVDRAGVNSNDPLVEKIRDEVYSKYPSFTYELDREYVRGYDRTYKNVVDSVVHQADLYGSSFYSKVGGEEALKALEQLGIEKTDPNLYKISLKYIQDEITSADSTFISRSAVKARKFVYLWQLGYDVSQLYLNAVAQPITQTYGYFSRIEYNGIRLKGLEPEQYFLRAGKLVKDSFLNKAPQDFKDLVTQLTNEHVLAPEFTRSLVDIDKPTGSGLVEKVAGESKNVVKKVFGNHWASIFMRKGEQVTRTHAAAEAFLVGKEKFKLTGDDLTKFVVKAVDATQSNPTRGENPYFIRSLGEGGKLVYQFMAFNQMWWENLAIGVKQTKGTQRAGFLAREFVPLGIMGGLTGLPLSAFAATLYSVITGRDPRKDIRHLLGTTKDSQMEAMANYGITGSAGLSQKLTPSAPLLDQTGKALTTDKTNISDLVDNVPIVSTGEQILLGFKDLTQGRKLKAVEGLLPRVLKGPAKALELVKFGQKDRAGNTVEAKNKVTPLQVAGQFVNITPNPVVEHYEEKRTKKLIKLRPFKKLKRLFN